jgi:hypothetical protein
VSNRTVAVHVYYHTKLHHADRRDFLCGVSRSRSENACLASVATGLQCHTSTYAAMLCVSVCGLCLVCCNGKTGILCFVVEVDGRGGYRGSSSLLILTCSVCGESQDPSTYMFTALLYSPVRVARISGARTSINHGLCMIASTYLIEFNWLIG